MLGVVDASLATEIANCYPGVMTPRVVDEGGESNERRILRVAGQALRVAASAHGEQELIAGVCQLMEDGAGYELAWVGLARDDAERSVEAVPVVRRHADYVYSLRLSWAESPAGQGPTGRAIRGGRPMVLNDLNEDPAYQPWLQLAQSHGFRASAAFPITDAGRVIAALNLYSGQADAFDEAELRLLEDVAAALSLGITRARQTEARERSNQALRMAHDQLEAVYNAVPDMVFVHGGDGRVLQVNAATEQGFGRSEHQMRTGPPEQLMGEGHSFEEAVAHVRRAMEQGSDDFMWVGRKADGTTFPCEVRLRRVPGERHSVEEPHVVGCARDLTELTRLQDALVQMQRFESLAVLAGGVAHDFNNLLANILGNVDLARAQAELGQAPGELLDRAKEATLQARTLARRLLGFTRGGSGRRARFDLGELLSEVAELVFADEERSPQIERPEHALEIDGDREQLLQVVGNLLRSALEASPEGGMVSAILRRGEAGEVTLEVRDDGPAIDPSVAPHIFDPFFRTQTRGSGLGLSSAFGVARRLGGKLELIEGKGGATFRLTLPAAGELEQAAAAPAPPLPSPSRRTAVVMDDQEGLRRLFARMLEQVGFEVVTASDGDEAIACCRRALEAGEPCCLALLDLTVPNGRGGHEILSELRELDATLVTVAATGYAGSDARAADFDGFLPKPFSLADLKSEIARLLPEHA